MARENDAHELIRVIGRKAITPKHHLHLVQIHNKLLLLVETPTGLQKLETIEGVDAASLLEDSHDTPVASKLDRDRLLELIQNRNLAEPHLHSRNVQA